MTERRPQTEAELVEHLRELDFPAPRALHERMEALVAERQAPPRRRAGTRSPAWSLAAAGAMIAAAVAVALLVSLGSSTSSSNVRAAAALALARPTAAAPAESTSNRSQLAAAVDGVAFPYWQEGLGWRSVGARRDLIAGRPVTTVFYADPQGRRVGYAIVGGTPAPVLKGGVAMWRGGTEYRLLSVNGASAVVWLRAGHLCVVAGRGVSSATLLALAGSDHGGTAA